MRMPNQLALLFLKFYRLCLSPLLPSVCRFEPTCSFYAAECFQRFNGVKAFKLMAKRLCRCQPFCAGGFDPVPE